MPLFQAAYKRRGSMLHFVMEFVAFVALTCVCAVIIVLTGKLIACIISE